jgi:hypothetical protein
VSRRVISGLTERACGVEARSDVARLELGLRAVLLGLRCAADVVRVVPGPGAGVVGWAGELAGRGVVDVVPEDA